MASPASAAGPVPIFKGGSLVKGRYRFRVKLSGKDINLGYLSPEAAEPGARLFDSLQLLLHGPHADTNFEWSSYTRADIAAAASFLEAKGVDVHQAIAAARAARGTTGDWIGVHQTAGRTSWAARIHCQVGNGAGYTTLHKSEGVLSAEAAAHQADCGLLATRGLGCTTNFPASTYSQQQLQEARNFATRVGAEAARVEGNLAAIEQVRCSLLAARSAVSGLACSYAVTDLNLSIVSYRQAGSALVVACMRQLASMPVMRCESSS
jgi:hypothetical protein